MTTPIVGYLPQKDVFCLSQNGDTARFTLLRADTGAILATLEGAMAGSTPTIPDETPVASPGQYWKSPRGDTLLVSLGNSLYELGLSPPYSHRLLKEFPSVPTNVEISQTSGATMVAGKNFAYIFTDRALSQIWKKLPPIKTSALSASTSTLWTLSESGKLELHRPSALNPSFCFAPRFFYHAVMLATSPAWPNIERFTMAPNSKNACFYGEQVLKVVDAENGKELWKRSADSVSQTVFSADSRLLAIVTKRWVDLVLVEDGQSIAKLSVPQSEQKTTERTRIQFSPCSSFLSIQVGGTLLLATVDPPTLRKVVAWAPDYRVVGSAFNVLGDRLAVTVSREVEEADSVGIEADVVEANSTLVGGSNHDKTVAANSEGIGETISSTVPEHADEALSADESSETDENGSNISIPELDKPAYWMLFALSGDVASLRKPIFTSPAFGFFKPETFGDDGLRAWVTFEQKVTLIDTTDGKVLHDIELPWGSGNLDRLLPRGAVFLSGHATHFQDRPLAFFSVASSLKKWVLSPGSDAVAAEVFMEPKYLPRLLRG